MRFLKALLFVGMIVAWVQPLHAGAWPRGKGNIFASSSASFTWPNGRAFEYPDIYGSAYVEYGLGDRVTMGLDIGSPDATRPSKLKAIAFMRYTLSTAQSRHQFALDFGAGKNLGNGMLRLGASYGTGLQLMERSGWLSIESHILYDIKSGKSTQNLDATLGINLERGKLMALLSAYRAPTGQSTFSFTPSYAHELSSARHLEIGVTLDLSRGADPALKLGIWQKF